MGLLKQREELYKSGAEIYSISKLSVYDQCPGSYKESYIDKLPKADNVYALIGGAIHDGLEEIYNNNYDDAKNREILQQRYDEILAKIDNFNNTDNSYKLEFPKYMGENGIEIAFKSCITNFINTFKREEGKRKNEYFILWKLDNGAWVQGFIDTIIPDIEKSTPEQRYVKIVDYKTSTKWRGKQDTIEHGRQLVLYAYILEKLTGMKVSYIGWNMLKYINVKYKGKTRKKNTLFLRNKLMTAKDGILKEIQAALTDKGYDIIDQADIIEKAVETNRIPEEVADMFEVWEGYLDHEYNEETLQEALNFVNNTIEKIRNDKEFIKSDITKDKEMYCNFLCNTRIHCEKLKNYKISQIKTKTSECEDLFEDIFS